MSFEEDSYYPEMSIRVPEEAYRALAARVPGGAVRAYVEALVRYARSGTPFDEAIFAQLHVRRQAEAAKNAQIKQLEEKLRHLRGR